LPLLQEPLTWQVLPLEEQLPENTWFETLPEHCAPSNVNVMLLPLTEALAEPVSQLNVAVQPVCVTVQVDGLVGQLPLIDQLPDMSLQPLLPPPPPPLLELHATSATRPHAPQTPSQALAFAMCESSRSHRIIAQRGPARN
jgi:hypothetical protein